MFEEVKKRSSEALGDFLDVLDTIPNAPKRPATPFPYGNSEPRPYGWFSK
jgi:hypothetical protein